MTDGYIVPVNSISLARIIAEARKCGAISKIIARSIKRQKVEYGKAQQVFYATDESFMSVEIYFKTVEAENMFFDWHTELIGGL